MDLRALQPLMEFCGDEFQGFFTHIGAVVQQYSRTGELPQRLFPQVPPPPAVPEGADPQDSSQKKKRGPKKGSLSAFQFFLKEKVQYYKDNGLDTNLPLKEDGTKESLLGMARDEWKNLSEEEKKAFTDRYKANPQPEHEHEEGDGAGPSDDLGANGSADLAAVLSPRPMHPIPGAVEPDLAQQLQLQQLHMVLQAQDASATNARRSTDAPDSAGLSGLLAAGLAAEAEGIDDPGEARKRQRTDAPDQAQEGDQP